MKTKDLELKEVIKEAILEAFAEMYGVATLDGEDTDDSAPEDSEDGEGSDKKKDPVRPGPVIGPVGLSLR